MLLVRCFPVLIGCCSIATDVIGQALWQVKAGASYMRCADPLGAGHGRYTGRAVDGMGYHFGATYGPSADRVLGIHGELLVDIRSTGYTFTESASFHPATPIIGTGGHGERSMRTVQLEMPLMLAIRKWPLLRLDVGGGVAHLLKAEERVVGHVNDNGLEKPLDERNDRTGSMARWEAAAVIGAEVDSGHRLSMGLRLWKGLTNLDRAEGSTISTATMWQLSMAYAFREAERTR
ncbi:MAG: hypothetical protein JNL43_16400 [Flavobacteriales bacterium]|nr:hypothetical protein [Flavobacteriales bacterium]